MAETPGPGDEVVLSPKEISALQELVFILKQEKGMARVGDLPGKYKEPLRKLRYVVDSAIITEDIVADIMRRYVSSASTVSNASSGDSRESVEKKKC